MTSKLKLKFSQLAYQKDAADAVVSMFKNQPNKPYRYQFDKGVAAQGTLDYCVEYAYGNGELKDNLDLAANLADLQRKFDLPRAEFTPRSARHPELEFCIDMETGTGKTYTYIKTMFELNAAYGWSKFIVVVPSIAIREGVYKTFDITAQHFLEEYGKRCHFFIYDSKKLQNIADFARGNDLWVMIINVQAFNAKGADARRIDMALDEFQSRRPIDVLAKTRPILIIDEPQSVEGKQTLENLRKFNPLFKLKYSATHKQDRLFNLVYRLDAMDAYNQKLVKKIAVKGIQQVGTLAQGGYVFLQKIETASGKAPRALLEFDYKGNSGIRKKTCFCEMGQDLFELSGDLMQYRDNFVISEISANKNEIRFLNGKTIRTGEVVGNLSESQKRRLQIRETILSHLEREQALFKRGIKVLSLFFIDEVAKYRVYEDAAGAETVAQGEYARFFEEEYQAIVAEKLAAPDLNDDYRAYLVRDQVSQVHNGYFSVDKKGHAIDSKDDRKEGGSNDVAAYDLIMHDKERLLSFDEPTRFIFSHSALKEGWDNPNVFQICTLKETGNSEIRRRQEVGRGLRLCVNQQGERMDANRLGSDVQNINCLTVIASESYADFAQGLQREIAEALSFRPQKITPAFFKNKILDSADGEKIVFHDDLANQLNFILIKNDYIDAQGRLTEKFHEDKKADKLEFGEKFNAYQASILKLLVQINSPLQIEDARDSKKVKLRLNQARFDSQAFKQLWAEIRPKTCYRVKFESDALIKSVQAELDKTLKVSTLNYEVEWGEMKNIASRESLEQGENFVRERQSAYEVKNVVGISERFDLVGKLVASTGLLRKTIVAILSGIQPATFAKFQQNPEEFILNVGKIINQQKARMFIASLRYTPTGEYFEHSLFSESDIYGVLGEDTREATKHLYDYLKYDSRVEENFSENLDVADIVDFYIKLPKSFFIDTPMGRYNPDWAVVFKEENIKHIYFIAETKGSTLAMDLRPVEETKIECAKKHFQALSDKTIKYKAVKDWKELLEELREIRK